MITEQNVNSITTDNRGHKIQTQNTNWGGTERKEIEGHLYSHLTKCEITDTFYKVKRSSSKEK